MGFYSQYPASASGSNSSVGGNGAPIPSDSTLVAGENPSGNLQPLQTDANGALYVSPDPAAPATHVIVDSSALPTGASTLAEQQAQTAILTTIDTDTGAIATSVASIDSKTPTVGQKAMVASSPVVIASDQSAIPVSGTVTVNQPIDVDVISSVLPTGASTLAEQQTQTALLTTIDADTGAIATSVASIDTKTPALGQAAMAASSPVVIANNQSAIPISGSVTVSGTVAATQSGTWNVGVTSSVLPTGAATEATLASVENIVDSIDQKTPPLGQATMTQSVPVVIASDQTAFPVSQSGSWTTSVGGKAINTAPVHTNYVSSPVNTSAYTQLVASTGAPITQLQIFDSSGQAMIIATGAAASEVIKLYVPPGGGVFDLAIPISTRISIKALTANATSGYNLLNMLS